MEFDWTWQNGIFGRGKAGFYNRNHRVGDFVDEGVDLFFGAAWDGHFVRENHLCDREIVSLGVLAKFLHGAEWILRRIFFRRRVTFPFDEAAADGVIFLFEQHIFAGEKFARHCVGMVKFALGRVENHVLQTHLEHFLTEFDVEGLIWIIAQLVEERGIDGRGLLANDAG